MKLVEAAYHGSPHAFLTEAADINSDAFKAWFAGSKVKNVDGSPKMCYHGTRASFAGSFKPFTHFGTLAAASDRIASKWDKQVVRPAEKNQWTGKVTKRTKYSKTATEFEVDSRILPVYLSIKNPFRYLDRASDDNITDVLAAMRSQYVINGQVYKDLLFGDQQEEEVEQWIIAVLSKRRYDGLVYRNTGEDPGKVSYVIFRPDQVWPAMLDQPD
jgi:hypothetical protein